MCATLGDDYALDFGAATAARLAGFLIDCAEGLEVTQRTIWFSVVANARPACPNPFFQYSANGSPYRPDFRFFKRTAFSHRVDFRLPERLVGVDIADACDASLVKKQGLNGSISLKLACQIFFGAFGRHGVMPQFALCEKFGPSSIIQKPYPPEFSYIRKKQTCSIEKLNREPHEPLTDFSLVNCTRIRSPCINS